MRCVAQNLRRACLLLQAWGPVVLCQAACADKFIPSHGLRPERALWHAVTPSSMRSWEVVVSSLESFEASGDVALSHGMVYRGGQHGRKTS